MQVKPIMLRKVDQKLIILLKSEDSYFSYYLILAFCHKKKMEIRWLITIMEGVLILKYLA